MTPKNENMIFSFLPVILEHCELRAKMTQKSSNFTTLNFLSYNKRQSFSLLSGIPRLIFIVIKGNI